MTTYLFQQFEGHVDQVDYETDGGVQRLHVIDPGGTRLTITIKPADVALDWLPVSGTLAFLHQEHRPTITIERDGA